MAMPMAIHDAGRRQLRLSSSTLVLIVASLAAFPVGAALAGALARRHDLLRCFAAALAGMTIIHLGGITQLSILSGGLTFPFRATAPLIAADLVKVVIATLLISRFRAGPPPRV